MKPVASILITLSLFYLVLSGCRRVVVYPDEPSITFTSLVSVDSADVLQNPVKRVTLTFHLIDGNGDIGLKASDTTGAYHKDSLFHYNLFIREYMLDGESFVEVPDPDGLKRFRIPDITPGGQNKTLMADISVSIEYPYSDQSPLPFSIFRYRFHVVDRALNLSNQDTTSIISW